jgi:hypothetical protein
MLKISTEASEPMVLDASKLEPPFRPIPGFVVHAKRPNPAMILTARAAARSARQRALEVAGIVMPSDPAAAGKILADHPQIQAAGEEAFTVALAVAGIVAWDGVIGPDNKPLKVTPENIRAVLQNQAAFDFLDRMYVGPALAQDEEKNASSPSRSTTSRRARPTAKAAGKRAAGPAPSAPTS